MMTTDDFVENYRRALACYSDHTFAEFFRLAGITDPRAQSIGKDYLGVAGAFYFADFDRQADGVTRTETLKELKRAKQASRKFADSLERAMADRSMANRLMEAGIAVGREIERSGKPNEDTLAILNAIFPIAADGSGFREEGLRKAMGALADSLERIEADGIEKRKRGRGRALHPWLLLMYTYWMEVHGAPPRVGHYHHETGDYDSPSIAALAYAAEQLDREISSHLVVKGMGDVEASIHENPHELVVLMSLGFGFLIAADVSVSDRHTLSNWSGMPVELMEQMGMRAARIPDEGGENAWVSEEEFFENLKSTKEGKIALQALMAIDGS